MRGLLCFVLGNTVLAATQSDEFAKRHDNLALFKTFDSSHEENEVKNARRLSERALTKQRGQPHERVQRRGPPAVEHSMGSSPRRGNVGCSADWTSNVNGIYDLAMSLHPTTDKMSQHSYEIMYGMFLSSLRGRRVKLLEIGLGCDMNYGPGASVNLWQHYLPNLELWEAEFNAACVARHQNDSLRGVHTLTGDQGDAITLDKWIRASTQNGLFDVIIDDGGHSNSQIKTSFDKLWPYLELGGFYFLEDLQVGRWKIYDETKGRAVMADVLKDWIEQLLIMPNVHQNASTQTIRRSWRHPIPPDVAFVACQLEACVVAKHSSHVGVSRPGHSPKRRAPTHQKRKQMTPDANNTKSTTEGCACTSELASAAELASEVAALRAENAQLRDQAK